MGTKLESLPIPSITYNYTTSQYSLDQILTYYQTDRIDTDLDCQRGLVWTPEKQQNLIDTIVKRERIPEFHVIKEETDTVFHFADGKQRITTIVNFLSNKLPWKKAYATKDVIEVFGDRNSLYFKDLPKSWQIAINNSNIQIAIYKNMTVRSTTILFRKLNSGETLSGFSRELAAHIPYKNHFLNGIMDHPAIEKLFTKSQIEGDEAQQTFIRAFYLMREYDRTKTCTPVDLRPKYFRYLDFETCTKEEEDQEMFDLKKYQKIIISLLDNFMTSNKTFRTMGASFQPLFALYYSYCNNYSAEQTVDLYIELRKIKAGELLGGGGDYNKDHVRDSMKDIENRVLSKI